MKRSTNDSTRYLARTAATPMVVFIIFVRAGMGWDSFARTLTKSSGVQIFYWIWLRSSSNASVWNLGTLGMCPPNLFGIYTETRQHGCQRTHLPTRPLRHVNPTPKLAGTDNIKQPQLSFQRKAIEDFRTHKVPESQDAEPSAAPSQSSTAPSQFSASPQPSTVQAQPTGSPSTDLITKPDSPDSAAGSKPKRPNDFSGY